MPQERSTTHEARALKEAADMSLCMSTCRLHMPQEKPLLLKKVAADTSHVFFNSQERGSQQNAPEPSCGRGQVSEVPIDKSIKMPAEGTCGVFGAESAATKNKKIKKAAERAVWHEGADAHAAS